MSEDKKTKNPDKNGWSADEFRWEVSVPRSTYQSTGFDTGIENTMPMPGIISSGDGIMNQIEREAVKQYQPLSEEQLKSALEKLAMRTSPSKTSEAIIESSWIDDMMGFSVSNKKSPKGKYNVIPYKKIQSYNGKIKKKIDHIQAIEAIDELIEKDIAKFVITGSLGLFLQNKLSRTVFSDIDLICNDDFQFDDDMSKMNRQQYEKNEELGEMSCFVINSIVFDVFKFEPGREINTVEVQYNGKTYLCQDYKDIIMAKLNMVLPKMKDYKEIFNNIIEVNFK